MSVTALLLAAGIALATLRVNRLLRSVGIAHERYRLVVESASDGILIVDGSGCVEANWKVCEIFGRSRDEMQPPHLWAILTPRSEPNCLIRRVRQMIAEGDQLCEFPLQRKDGTPIVVEASGKSLSGGGEVMILRDITERKRMEESLRRSLKEVHHRVKNNLQIISSMLSLQSASLDDPTALREFQDCRDRVAAIALVHETLYRSKDLARTDFPLYVNRLMSSLSKSYQDRMEGIRFDVQVEIPALDLDAAIPCGLIINELVTNSFKHAFPNGRTGEIYLRMIASDGERVRLTVGDTGVGLPPGLSMEKTESLGLQLVQALTEQLGGIAKMNGHRGTEFSITFLREIQSKGKDVRCKAHVS